jgi:hypothetical protein
MSGIHLALLGMNFGSTETTVEYLVIAGGGGGGTHTSSFFGAGGGGGGGYRTDTGFVATFGTAYTVTTGAGGAGSSDASAQGSSGSNSVFSTITSAGGGGGGSMNSPSRDGLNGGSGGGAGSGVGALAQVDQAILQLPAHHKVMMVAMPPQPHQVTVLVLVVVGRVRSEQMLELLMGQLTLVVTVVQERKIQLLA